MQTEIRFEVVYDKYGSDCEVKGVTNYQNIDGDWIVQSEEKRKLSAKEQVEELIQAGVEGWIALQVVTMEAIRNVTFEAGKLIKADYSLLRNLRMAEKIVQGDAIDLSGCEKTKEGYYILEDFIAGIDYCDSKDETWIWSIGISYESGQILASKSKVFFQNPDFECLFLR